MQVKEAGGKVQIDNIHMGNCQPEKVGRGTCPPGQVVDRDAVANPLQRPALAMHWLEQQGGDTSD